MQYSRKYLPSMQSLTAFEVAARTDSFTEAARILNLTQSAVSRQIFSLEKQLGVRLFDRERQSVCLNRAGRHYAEEIRKALGLISSASLNVKANPSGGLLRLAILPTFGTRWLAPRLSKFLTSHTGITISLATQLRAFDFDLEGLDAAIHFGLPDNDDVIYEYLLKETVVPACSPQFRADFKIKTPHDLVDVPRLKLSSRTGAWAQWFSQMNVDTKITEILDFDQFATAAQAAISGIGVALLPEFLIEEELARGELVRAIDMPMQSKEAYYLAYPKSKADYPPLKIFRDWIVTAAAEEE